MLPKVSFDTRKEIIYKIYDFNKNSLCMYIKKKTQLLDFCMGYLKATDRSPECIYVQIAAY